MKRSTKLLTLCMLAAFFGGAERVSAAWDNVFQATCNNCKPRTSTSYFAPCPTAVPTISYRQRSCYQPITTYKMQTTLEPVTTYRTSYYWSPVTSYKYTSYYDPCTGCSQQVATPVTSYKLKSQCNAVQSYVQRSQLVPVQEVRESFYYEPVVSYYTPPCTGCPTSSPSPSITETQQPPLGETTPNRMPSINERDGGTDRIPPTGIPSDSSSNKGRSIPAPVKKPSRIDNVASLGKSGRIQGTVVLSDRITPLNQGKLLFVKADKQGDQFSVKTTARGTFETSLESGEWLLYVIGNQGKPQFHSKVNIRSQDDRLVTVVSR